MDRLDLLSTQIHFFANLNKKNSSQNKFSSGFIHFFQKSLVDLDLIKLAIKQNVQKDTLSFVAQKTG